MPQCVADENADAGMEVLVGEIAIGTLVVVKPGEQVPIDGKVVTGSSRVNQSMMTGESVPLKKVPGDEVSCCLCPVESNRKGITGWSYVIWVKVMGGTLNCGGGHLEIETTSLAGDSTVARMANLVEQADTPPLVKRSELHSSPLVLLKFVVWNTSAQISRSGGKLPRNVFITQSCRRQCKSHLWSQW